MNHHHRPDNETGILVGLLFECPRGGNPSDCQLHDIRELPVADRIAFLNRLTPEVQDLLLTNHGRCFARKESKMGEPEGSPV